MSNYNLQALSVLYVDPNRRMHAIVKSILDAMWISKVRFVADAAEAYVDLRRSLPDILITDWLMELGDGLGHVRQVREEEDSPNPYLPIILLTAHTEQHRVIAARDAGVTEILAKPVSIKGLYTRIIEIVERPRPFVKTKHFFGPDRRRLPRNFSGTEKRAGEALPAGAA